MSWCRTYRPQISRLKPSTNENSQTMRVTAGSSVNCSWNCAKSTCACSPGGEASALEVIDTLFAEELTLRENRRVKMALRMAKLSTIKTLAGISTSPSSRHSTAIAFSLLPSSTSLAAMR